MKNRFGTFLKAFFSDEALRTLHETRKAQDPEQGVRSQVNAVVSMFLFSVVLAVLVVAAWVPQNVDDYLKSRENLVVIGAEDQKWSTTAFTALECQFPLGCWNELRSSTLKPVDPAELDQTSNPSRKTHTGLVRIEIMPSTFERFSTLRSFVVSLPGYRYFRAAAFADGEHVKTFLLGERIFVGFETAKQINKPLVLDLVFELDTEQRVFAGVRNGEKLMVAAPGELERFVAFMNERRTGTAGAVGMVAKIAIALFCLLLFLVIDSSPESLGLGLFMGFEAAAMAIGPGWLPLGPLAPHKAAIGHFFWQAGDIMKLYFLLQIARFAAPSPSKWLIVTVLLSIPYGFFMQWGQQQGLNSIWQIPRTRDTIVGLVGGWACFRALWYLRAQTLPWRKTALVIAGSAGILEVAASWMAHSIQMMTMPIIQTAYTVLQGNIGYLFAVSTFLNISTLENRVRSLTKAQLRAKEIERELDIARMVQRSLLVPPSLPRGISLSCYQEAALYVSGDTYFVNWDRRTKRFTFMLNDVTGHGIQAALKASACNVLAKTIWHDEAAGTTEVRPSGWNLRRFDNLAQELLIEEGNIPDFNSMIAAEFESESGKLTVYRSNFSFPILIQPCKPGAHPDEPVLGEFWNVSILPTPNQNITSIEIPHGTFILFLSDGFLESSRDLKKFTNHMRQKLASRNGRVDVNAINEMALRFEGFSVNRKNDDRTILVFQWEFPEAAQGVLPVPANG
jgi:hypothetical protein